MLQVIEFFGIITFALSGIVVARRKGMDLVGVYTVALITAFGGGTLRDLFIDRTPLFWVANHGYAILFLVLSFGAFLLGRAKWHLPPYLPLSARQQLEHAWPRHCYMPGWQGGPGVGSLALRASLPAPICRPTIGSTEEDPK